MDAARAALALADASSSMTRTHDTTGALIDLLTHCEAGLDVDASGILLGVHDGALELLVTSSHAAAELEMYQLNDGEGPCLEAHATGESVDEHSKETLVHRWPQFGQAMIDAGFESVHALPLRINTSSVGAIGLFRRSGRPRFTTTEGTVARAFADIASMLLIQHGDVSPEELAQRVQEALGERVVIEQAKGVLADRHGLSMPDAYERLVHDAHDEGESLTGWAGRVVRDSQTPR
ncbi:ANTAR domain-containing protein [Aeromicrobium chenweiae]|uniref:Uncharacterized protein n=1 Tax=Aeromicrobium chenweiae TaxID=2079793 RepID=A0A2S0WII9_9ACTN|nr:ANTAR domain-containing protein [Aeromicrobium chenweiae]AWB91102.1 hypothetical protein C3E78_02060 [Aeromicrobium chenweiae]TGN32005.1 ANTAR domain-containing protein [Aeromicrobium chenweiae]